MKSKITIFVLLALVIVIPFALKKESVINKTVTRTLILVGPHNEAVRYEFSQGFQKWYYKNKGETVKVDWRVLGGTREIIRYIDSVYANAFKLYWENTLKKPWNSEVQAAFEKRYRNQTFIPGTLEAEVRDAFLKSNVSCGIDVIFGGSKTDIEYQAKKGQIVSSGIFKKHPEWFEQELIPKSFEGNNFWDKDKLWIGNAISGFGIIYNTDSLRDLGYEGIPTQWVDLTSPHFIGKLALTDPTVSGSFTTVFEMIIQQQIQASIDDMLQKGAPHNEETELLAVKQGWERGLKIIQLISANARYFTDSSTKTVLDVASGNCAAGMCIDYYGLFQQENLRIRSGSNRFGFVIPIKGSVVSPDPIAMFRGAPHPDLALDFIEFVLSVDGQKLWDFKIDTPGGPILYSLSRAPIRKELYESELLPYRRNPDLDLYRDTKGFHYNAKWTTPLINELRFVVKCYAVNTHNELVDAWKAVNKAKAEGHIEASLKAKEILQNLEVISYDNLLNNIKRILHSGDPLEETRLSSKLSLHFKKQYQLAQKIANKG